MQRLKDIYPEYAEKVDFYAVASSAAMDLQELENHRAERNHPWPVASPEGTVLQDLRIVSQSSKVAFNSRGVITYRDGYGGGDAETWRQVLAELSESQ